jgi:hypothetical protein
MPGPLYSRGKSTGYPLDRRLGGPQNRSGAHGEEKIYVINHFKIFENINLGTTIKTINEDKAEIM